jgi:stage II sporulation protein AA (anti-sigma F factor antagonist)
MADVKWERKDGVLIAVLSGRIDSGNAGGLQSDLESGIDAGERALVLDFEHVSFLSSAGLRVCLVIARKFNEPGKEFGICTPSDPIRDVVAISGFDQIIAVHDSQTAAINACK